jgi:D-aminopeptidase
MPSAHRRARDFGLMLPGVPGPHNATTDVPGVEVGFATVAMSAARAGETQVHTGVTAILPRGRQARPVLAGQFDLNGNGEMTGTHWIRDARYFTGPVCLTNSHSVGVVRHAAVRYRIATHAEHLRGFHAWALRVVAETYDGVCSGICGLHVTEERALAALRDALPGPVAAGNVGGGTGMATSELTVLGVPVGRHLTDNAIFSDHQLPEQGSIIVLIATDVPMTALQLRRLAKRGALGVGRAATSGGHYSGDPVIAFSVANPVYHPAIGEPRPFSVQYVSLGDAHCDQVYPQAVDAVEQAVLNALFAAKTIPTCKPPGLQLEAIDTDALPACHGRL